MGAADAVGTVRSDSETRHFGDDQEQRVFQCEGVFPELPEHHVQVGVLALVLPNEMVPLPNVGPAIAPSSLRAPRSKQ